MAKSFFISAVAAGINFNDAATNNAPLSGRISLFAVQNTTFNSNILYEAGTFSNLYAYVSANALSGNSVVSLNKAASATSLTFTYTAGQTGAKEDTSNTEASTSSDVWNYSVANASEAGTITITYTMLGIVFTPDTTTNCATEFITNLDVSVSSDIVNIPNGVGTSGITTDASVSYEVRQSTVSSRLGAGISANSRDADVTIITRVNAADGAQSVVFSAGQTGYKVDSSNTDSLVSGDLYNYKVVVAAGTGSITLRNFSSTLVSTDNSFAVMTGSTNTGTSINFNTTTYTPLGGNAGVNATEDNVEYLAPFDFTAKQMNALIAANTIATSDTTITLRKNGADTSLALTVPAGTTGLRNDTSNTVSITDGDTINYKIVTPNTSGAITARWIGMLGDTSGGVVVTTKFLSILNAGT